MEDEVENHNQEGSMMWFHGITQEGEHVNGSFFIPYECGLEEYQHRIRDAISELDQLKQKALQNSEVQKVYENLIKEQKGIPSIWDLCEAMKQREVKESDE